MKQRFSLPAMFWAVMLVWLAACSGYPASDVAEVSGPATPSAVSLPTRKIEPVEVVVVTRVIEPDQEDGFGEIRPGILPEEEQIAATRHFDVYAASGFPALVHQLFRSEADAIFDDVAMQLGTDSSPKISLSIRPPVSGSCSPRGLTILAESPQIIVFTAEDTGDAQMRAVLAHEIGHVLLQYGFEPSLTTDRALNEGFATWAAQRYWNAWHGFPSLSAAVRGYRDASSYLPLHENTALTDVYPGANDFEENCLQRRDILYSEWAAFIDYLIQAYGQQKLMTLFATATPTVEDEGAESEALIINPPDYEAVYGQALNQLEAAWLRSLTQ